MSPPLSPPSSLSFSLCLCVCACIPRTTSLPPLPLSPPLSSHIFHPSHSPRRPLVIPSPCKEGKPHLKEIKEQKHNSSSPRDPNPEKGKIVEKGPQGNKTAPPRASANLLSSSSSTFAFISIVFFPLPPSPTLTISKGLCVCVCVWDTDTEGSPKPSRRVLRLKPAGNFPHPVLSTRSRSN